MLIPTKMSPTVSFAYRTARILPLILASLWSPHAAGDIVTLEPSRDNTIYEESGSESSGVGAFLFSGKTGPNNSGALRRTLLFFDIVNGDGQNAGIPPGSTIDNVTLTLRVSRSRSGNESMAVHKLTQDWGEEGSTNVGFGGTGGKGGSAQTNDATWTHGFFNISMSWTNPGGGDFELSASDTASVGESGDGTWSSAQMIADVQDWLDNPSSNFGWIIKGNESTQRTAKRFNSRENGSNPPTLTIDFTPGSAGTTFTVNSNDDVDDGLCNTTHCSLREAIDAANSTTGTDTITFNIPGSGPHSIQPSSALPTITDPVIIDGYTQPGASPNSNPLGLGSNAVLVIELDGSNAGSADGIFITAADCTVQGLVINRFGFAGIYILGAGASGNVVQGNFIGTDVTGSVDLGNAFPGVEIQDAPNNTVGGSQAGQGNVISGNDENGIYIVDAGASGNLVQGNYIGTDLTGTAKLGNAFPGVEIQDAPNNTVGGSQVGEGNVISGNDASGIFIIGTDVTGTADLGNSLVGVQIQNAPNNTVGGLEAGARNVISGNDQSGIFIVLGEASGNTVQGNYIGTDASGSADLGNTFSGVAIQDAPGNTVGGSQAGEGNLISGNDNRGVFILGNDASGNVVQGNFIGTDLTGTADLGNAFSGVKIQDAPNNTVGGSDAGARNIISGNDGDGIFIVFAGASGNVVQGNFIGTDVTGSADLGNTIVGVEIEDAPSNTVGGSQAGARNVISGNDENGILIMLAGASENVVQGNYIGTDVTGSADFGQCVFRCGNTECTQ